MADTWILIPAEPSSNPKSSVHHLVVYTFFGLHAGGVHSDSAVVSDEKGVGGVPGVRISVQRTHSACQKQWNVGPRQWTSTWRSSEVPTAFHHH